MRRLRLASRIGPDRYSKSWMPATQPNVRLRAMVRRVDDLRIRPGRIRDGNRGARKSKSYVAQVMRAAKKAGHTGWLFGGEPPHSGEGERRAHDEIDVTAKRITRPRPRDNAV